MENAGLRKGSGLILGCFLLLAITRGGFAADNVVFQDNFENSNNWDWNYKKGDANYKEEGVSRLGGVSVKDNCFILGTAGTGATLKKNIPRDFIIETKLKVSIVKSKPDEPDPPVPSAKIFLRKTEDKLWRSYVVQFWFLKDGDGIVLIRQFSYDLAGGNYLPEKPLFEKPWRLLLDTWYDVRIMVVANQITVWLNGEEVGTALDPDNLYPEGDVALSGGSWPSYAFFKDFKVLKAE